eukprot:gnl/TRDRNA2_/TRDRNA2_200069_c0_seq1.p1 gnl/TRDRNA2_/TRDRNA2_200069_c0~~gnl/TRDRNA2_/TRDRNA2_200069_c0_seq1.p1  ORF type:complete len:177 (-),score=15.47 gnl/TRDRNA2_/TRDRNA2_200069_c0_seq1:105-635(-)
MSCLEVVTNDIDHVVKVWWQNEYYQQALVDPDRKDYYVLRPGQLAEKKFLADMSHQVCVSEQLVDAWTRGKCIDLKSPDLFCRTEMYVSHILRDGSQEKVKPGYPDNRPTQPPIISRSNLATLPQHDQGRDLRLAADYFLLGLFALMSYMLAAVGLKKLRIFNYPDHGLQDPLAHR